MTHSRFTAQGDGRSYHHLGKALTTEEDGFHWAPCVHYDGKKFVMLYSRSTPGQANWTDGHLLYRAESVLPEGPYFRTGKLNLPQETVFAIDPDVYTRAGQLMLAYVTELWDHELYKGTGIMEVGISPDLSQILGLPRLLVRPGHSAHLYEKDRVIPWRTMQETEYRSGDKVDWYVVEAPVGGLVSPEGRDVLLYSCGNYNNKTYAIGALRANERGEMVDLASVNHFVLRSDDVPGIQSVGHPSLVRSNLIISHGRFGDQPRQAFFVPFGWDDQDRPIALQES